MALCVAGLQIDAFKDRERCDTLESLKKLGCQESDIDNPSSEITYNQVSYLLFADHALTSLSKALK